MAAALQVLYDFLQVIQCIGNREGRLCSPPLVLLRLAGCLIDCLLDRLFPLAAPLFSTLLVFLLSGLKQARWYKGGVAFRLLAVPAGSASAGRKIYYISVRIRPAR